MTLELGGGDLEATDFHDLLEPIDDKDVVVLVDDNLVPRPDPPKSTARSVFGIPRNESLRHTHR